MNMDEVIFEPCVFKGKINAPPSKSFAHRAIICAALSRGRCVISGISMSKDMEASLNFVKAIGAGYVLEGDKLEIFREGNLPEKTEVDCLESGSTLRFIIPIFGALGIECGFQGRSRLPKRPMNVYSECLPEHGAALSSSNLPLKITGRLRSGVYRVRGDVSSQFVSGLLFALPLLEGDSEIHVIGDFQSKSYVNITICVLKTFGIEITEEGGAYYIKGSQKYQPANYVTEGDWSQAAFFMTMGALSERPVTVSGLNMDSPQGDRKVLDIYRMIGADIKLYKGGFKIKRCRLDPVEVDAGDIPDAVPALAACLSMCSGQSRIINAARLRLKESDRLSAVSGALNALGGSVEETEDGLIINGIESFAGGSADACNDHRILMAVSSLMGVCKGKVTSSHPWCVNKSYPGFYKDYVKLGGSYVINLGE